MVRVLPPMRLHPSTNIVGRYPQHRVRAARASTPCRTPKRNPGEGGSRRGPERATVDGGIVSGRLIA